MTAYIIRRILSVIPITLGVLLLVFMVYRVIGGDPAARLAGKNATPRKIEQIRKTMGYDKPKFFAWQHAWESRQPLAVFDAQFWHVARKLTTFDFGQSLKTHENIKQMLSDGVGPSLCVTTPMFLLDLLIGVSLALICAYYRNSWIDRGFVVLSIVGMSISGLVYIMMGQYWLAFKAGWFPVWGFESPAYLLLPVGIGVISGIGGTLRFYRTIMLDEMYQDYVRTAFAKGCSQRQVLFKHVLKNAMIPILTNVVLTIPFLYTGALLLESFFGIPGLGRMTVDAIYDNDEPVLFTMVFIGSVVFVIANVLTDVLYTWADPRIRLR